MQFTKLFRVLTLTLLFSYLSSGYVHAVSETNLHEEPIQLQSKTFLDFRSTALKDAEIDTFNQLGPRIDLYLTEQFNTGQVASFSIVEDNSFPYTRIDIPEYGRKSRMILENTVTDESWIINIGNENVFEIQPGDYRVWFKGLPEEDVTLEIYKVVHPFVGRLGVLSPDKQYALADIEGYLADGGYLLVYSQDQLALELGLVKRNVSFQEVQQNLFTDYFEDKTIELLDVSEIHSQTVVNAKSTTVNEASLVEYIPINNGGIIYISETVLLLDSAEFNNVLNEIAKVFDTKTISGTEILTGLESLSSVGIVLMAISLAILYTLLLRKQLKGTSERVFSFNLKSVAEITSGGETKFAASYKSLLSKIVLSFAIPLLLALFVLFGNYLNLFPQSILSTLKEINISLEELGIVSVTSLLVSVVGIGGFLLTLPLLPAFLKNILNSEMYKNIEIGVMSFYYRYSFIKHLIRFVIVAATLVYLAVILLRYFGLGNDIQITNFKLSTIAEDNNLTVFTNEIVLDKLRLEVPLRRNYHTAQFTLAGEFTEGDSEIMMATWAQGSKYELTLVPKRLDGIPTTQIGDYKVISNTNALNRSSSIEGLIDASNGKRVGIDRLSFREDFLDTRSMEESFTWSDFIRNSTSFEPLATEPSENSYSLNGLSGHIQLYTFLESELELTLKYTDYNRRLGRDEFIIVVSDANNKIVHIEEVQDDNQPLGTKSLNNSATISIDDLNRGVYQLSILASLDELYGQAKSYSTEISLDSITINSSKLVYRSLSDSLLYQKIGTQYVRSRDTNLQFAPVMYEGLMGYTDVQAFTSKASDGELVPLVFSEEYGTNSITSYYSLYAPSEESYFNPFTVDIGSILVDNDITLIKNYEVFFDNLSMYEPVKVELSSIGKSVFYIKGDLEVTISEK